MSMLDDMMNAAGGGGLDLNALAGQLAGGNLQAILGQLEQGGLGHIVQSWMSSGANLPISHHQLQAVLGSDMVRNLAASAGIDPSQVANLLPHVVDHLTPNGQMPGNLDDVLGQLGGNSGLGAMLGGLLNR